LIKKQADERRWVSVADMDNSTSSNIFFIAVLPIFKELFSAEGDL